MATMTTTKTRTTMMNPKYTDLLDSIYLSTNGDPASFSSPLRLFQAAKLKDPAITKNDVDRYLEGQESYTRHSRILRTHPRRSYLTLYKNETWGCDIIYLNEMKVITKQRLHNQPNYGLICVDLFTKFGMGAVMVRKTPADTLKAFQKILSETKSQPAFLHVRRVVN